MAVRRVGWCGLGGMGSGMSQNVLKYLLSDANGGQFARTLVVYNRDTAKSERFVESEKAHDAAVTSVVSDLLETLAPGSIVVECSTVLPETTDKLAALAQSKGVSYVAAPVFGRPDAAAAARLIVCPGGPAEAVAEVRPLLASMSRKIMGGLGTDPKAANVLKLMGNFTIASSIDTLAQAMTLGDKNGVSREVFLDWCQEFMVSPAICGYGKRMADNQFEAGAGFTVDLAVKDLGHVRRIAETSSTHVPMADTVFQHLLQARATGHGQADWGAVALSVRQSSGVAEQSQGHK